jgi:hypothetical protein
MYLKDIGASNNDVIVTHVMTGVHNIIVMFWQYNVYFGTHVGSYISDIAAAITFTVTNYFSSAMNIEAAG